jgi:hypothetical protein
LGKAVKGPPRAVSFLRALVRASLDSLTEVQQATATRVADGR